MMFLYSPIRDEKLEEVYDKIERDLEIIGATAIEDKLQVEVDFLV